MTLFSLRGATRLLGSGVFFNGMHPLALIVSLILLSVLYSQRTYATHAMGADLTYVCLGGDSLEVTVAFYRDCEGINAPNDVDIDIVSASCGFNFTETLDFVSFSETTPVCTSLTTECDGGTLPGSEEYIYRGIIELPAACDDWTIGFTECCRNFDINTIDDPNGNEIYTEAFIDNLNAPCNSSPAFSVSPVPFVCDGQNFCFNNGAVDPDGDSLVFFLITPRTGPNAGDTVEYLAGYSATNPLSSSPALAVDSVTGDVCMTPTNSGETTVLAIMVEEWRNGQLIGSVIRDIQLRILNCPNPNTSPSTNGINGTGLYTATVCSEDTFSFTTDAVDPDAGQLITMTWNSGITGSSFAISNDSLPTGSFSWFPTANDISSTPHCFTTTVEDDNCPFTAVQTFSYCITVVGVESAISATTDPSCPGDCDGSATVTVSGGVSPYTYLWDDGSAQTTATATGLCAGTYHVTVTDSTGCFSIDTVEIDDPTAVSATIGVASNFNGSDVSCFGEADGSAEVEGAGGAAPYTYLWDAAASSQANDTAFNLAAGTYSVTITDSEGCDTVYSVTLTDPAVLQAAATVSSNYNGADISCFGASDGSVLATPTGGTAGYTYLWSTSGTAATDNNLAAGDYTVTITDANGCTAVADTTLIDPTALTATASPTTNYTGFEVSCYGASDGGATVVGTGGTGAYTYAWDAAAGNSTNDSVSALPIGTYLITVTDANTCTAVDSVDLTQPDSISLNLVVTTNYNGEDISCYGLSDGAVDLTATGGVNSFTYLWGALSNNQVTDSITNLPAGYHVVTVTDQNGCSKIDSIFVDQPDSLQITAAVTSNYNGADISCFGASDGSIGSSPLGGTTPYTYLWSANSGSQTTSAASNLSSGTYTVTVTDVNGCTAVNLDSLVDPTPRTTVSVVTSNYNGEDISCFGLADGAVQNTPGGGISPYGILWDNSTGNQVGTAATNLSAGTYYVTSTDANGCTISDSVVVTHPALLTVSAGATTNYNGFEVACFLGADGGVLGTGTGGTGTYTYAWDAGAGNATTASVNNLAASTYTITITDVNACTAEDSVTLNQPDSIIPTLTVTSDYNGFPISCYGLSDGAAEVTVIGGVAAYSYQWGALSNNQTTDSITNIPVGYHVVTITDQNNCTATDSILVNQPDSLVLTASVSSNYNGEDISCFGFSDGTLGTTTGGGNIPYSYQWTTNAGGQTVANPTGLASGSYTVTVTDVNGCTISDTVSLVDPAPLTLSSSITTNYNGEDISCFGNADGAVQTAAGGGVSPYGYLWDASTGNQTGTDANSLAAGTYTVTTTDANGCTLTDSIAVSQPTIVGASAGATTNYNGFEVSCNGFSDGGAQVNPSGGVPAYTYSWDAGAANATTAAVATLSIGTYTVTVTDLNGCTALDSVTLNQPTPIADTVYPTTNYNFTNISCYGFSDGAAIAIGSGSVGPYSYQWGISTANQVTDSVTGLAAGFHYVTITDQNNCTISDSVFLIEPDSLFVTGTVSSNYNGAQISCYGLSDGSISTVHSGGIFPYTYVWSGNANGQTTSAPSGLAVGSYTVTITDANGCTNLDTIVISQPDSLTISTVVSSNYNGVDISCFGFSDGEATTTPDGGIMPYGLLWDASTGNQTGVTAAGLSSGTYQVTFTDANGCTSSDSVTLVDPPLLQTTTQIATSYNGEDVSCFGASDGQAFTTPTGGVQPYNYLWTPNAANQTTNIAFSIPSGTYTVTVTDVNNCNITSSITLIDPPPLVISSTVTSDYNGEDISCAGFSDGVAATSGSGGTTPFTILWDANASSQSTLAATGLSAGTYSVTLTDANGCTILDSVSLSEPPDLVLPLSIASNYNGEDVSCFGASDGSASAAPGGGTGAYTILWDASANNATTLTAGNLAAGTYSVTVTDVNACTETSSISLTQPNPLVLSTQITSNYNGVPVSCTGFTDGAGMIDVSGGVPGYSILWDANAQNQITDTANNLGNGTYAVQVTDLNGCLDTAYLTITDPSPVTSQTFVTSNYNGADISCFGVADGQAAVAGGGGIAPYTYSWDASTGSQVGDTAFNIASGSYLVTVTDLNGCTRKDTVTLSQPTEILVTTAVVSNYNGEDISCFGLADGIASAAAIGGTGNYAYNWGITAGGQSTAQAVTLQAATYVVTITDDNGCTSTESVTLTEPPLLEIQSSTVAISCFGVANGEVMSTPSGGTIPYIFNWSNGNTTQNTSGLGPGSYSVTVTDVNGCTVSITEQLIEPGPVAVFPSPGDTICPGETVTLSATAAGGAGGHLFSWSNGLPVAPSHTVSPTETTFYSVSAFDINNCLSPVAVIEIHVRELEFGNLGLIDSVGICPGESTSFEATYSGGNTSVDFNWDNGLGSNLGPITVTPAQTTTYRLFGTNICNDSISDSVKVIVHPIPVLSLPSVIDTGCAPFTVTLSDPNPDPNVAFYNWNLGNGITSGSATPTITYDQPGVYPISVSGTSIKGCAIGQASGLIAVFDSPIASFTATPKITNTSNANITFTDQSQGASFFSWTFGDGSSSNDRNPTNQYFNAGTYTVELRVENEFGCPAFASDQIIIEPYLEVEIPNAFTPDPSGSNGGFFDPTAFDNNVFAPFIQDVDEYHLMIFNRWGEMIFESYNPQIGWDGYYRGELVPLGVYVWKIDATFVNGIKYVDVGDVTVLR